jgi:hypothetical protein
MTYDPIGDMLPERQINFHALAKQIMIDNDLPDKLYAVRRTDFSMQEIISMLLAWRNETQYRVDGGRWQYTYDPITADLPAIMFAIKDAARIRLGCDHWGCRTAADLNEITFEDSLGNNLDEWMKEKEDKR